MIGKRLYKQLRFPLKNADPQLFEQTVRLFLQNRRIFLTGAGRSGLVTRFFGMRLMHLGMQSHIVSDTTTPAIEEGDLLVAVSASGNTSGVIGSVESARTHHAMIVGITANGNGELASLSDHLVMIDSRRHRKRKDPEDRAIPMGTSFELGSLLYLEALIIRLMEISGIDEAQMKRRHANL